MGFFNGYRWMINADWLMKIKRNLHQTNVAWPPTPLLKKKITKKKKILGLFAYNYDWNGSIVDNIVTDTSQDGSREGPQSTGTGHNHGRFFIF